MSAHAILHVMQSRHLQHSCILSGTNSLLRWPTGQLAMRDVCVPWQICKCLACITNDRGTTVWLRILVGMWFPARSQGGLLWHFMSEWSISSESRAHVMYNRPTLRIMWPDGLYYIISDCPNQLCNPHMQQMEFLAWLAGCLLLLYKIILDWHLYICSSPIHLPRLNVCNVLIYWLLNVRMLKQLINNLRYESMHQ